jgi:hypothetical protein
MACHPQGPPPARAALLLPTSPPPPLPLSAPQQGAFGGDFGELAAGIAAYFKATGTSPTEPAVASIFEAFMRDVATPARPFYFHSAHEKMQSVFAGVAKAGVTPEPVILPATCVRLGGRGGAGEGRGRGPGGAGARGRCRRRRRDRTCCVGPRKRGA